MSQDFSKCQRCYKIPIDFISLQCSHNFCLQCMALSVLKGEGIAFFKEQQPGFFPQDKTNKNEQVVSMNCYICGEQTELNSQCTSAIDQQLQVFQIKFQEKGKQHEDEGKEYQNYQNHQHTDNAMNNYFSQPTQINKYLYSEQQYPKCIQSQSVLNKNIQDSNCYIEENYFQENYNHHHNNINDGNFYTSLQHQSNQAFEDSSQKNHQQPHLQLIQQQKQKQLQQQQLLESNQNPFSHEESPNLGKINLNFKQNQQLQVLEDQAISARTHIKQAQSQQFKLKLQQIANQQSIENKQQYLGQEKQQKINQEYQKYCTYNVPPKQSTTISQQSIQNQAHQLYFSPPKSTSHFSQDTSQFQSKFNCTDANQQEILKEDQYDILQQHETQLIQEQSQSYSTNLPIQYIIQSKQANSHKKTNIPSKSSPHLHSPLGVKRDEVSISQKNHFDPEEQSIQISHGKVPSTNYSVTNQNNNSQGISLHSQNQFQKNVNQNNQLTPCLENFSKGNSNNQFGSIDSTHNQSDMIVLKTESNTNNSQINNNCKIEQDSKHNCDKQEGFQEQSQNNIEEISKVFNLYKKSNTPCTTSIERNFISNNITPNQQTSQYNYQFAFSECKAENQPFINEAFITSPACSSDRNNFISHSNMNESNNLTNSLQQQNLSQLLCPGHALRAVSLFCLDCDCQLFCIECIQNGLHKSHNVKNIKGNFSILAGRMAQAEHEIRATIELLKVQENRLALMNQQYEKNTQILQRKLISGIKDARTSLNRKEEEIKDKTSELLEEKQVEISQKINSIQQKSQALNLLCNQFKHISEMSEPTEESESSYLFKFYSECKQVLQQIGLKDEVTLNKLEVRSQSSAQDELEMKEVQNQSNTTKNKLNSQIIRIPHVNNSTKKYIPLISQPFLIGGYSPLTSKKNLPIYSSNKTENLIFHQSHEAFQTPFQAKESNHSTFGQPLSLNNQSSSFNSYRLADSSIQNHQSQSQSKQENQPQLKKSIINDQAQQSSLNINSSATLQSQNTKNIIKSLKQIAQIPTSQSSQNLYGTDPSFKVSMNSNLKTQRKTNQESLFSKRKSLETNIVSQSYNSQEQLSLILKSIQKLKTKQESGVCSTSHISPSNASKAKWIKEGDQISLDFLKRNHKLTPEVSNTNSSSSQLSQKISNSFSNQEKNIFKSFYDSTYQQPSQQINQKGNTQQFNADSQQDQKSLSARASTEGGLKTLAKQIEKQNSKEYEIKNNNQKQGYLFNQSPQKKTFLQMQNVKQIGIAKKQITELSRQLGRIFNSSANISLTKKTSESLAETQRTQSPQNSIPAHLPFSKQSNLLKFAKKVPFSQQLNYNNSYQNKKRLDQPQKLIKTLQEQNTQFHTQIKKLFAQEN